MAAACEQFLHDLLKDKATQDVMSRIWSRIIFPALKSRRQSANEELEKLISDARNFPINYNHYYTDTINKRRLERQRGALAECIENHTSHKILPECRSDHMSASINVDNVISSFSQKTNPDMEDFSCEEALDCLFAIYKVR